MGQMGQIGQMGQERIDTAFNQTLSHIYPTFIPHLSNIYQTSRVPGLKPQPWRPKRRAKRAVGAKHLGGSKGREVSTIIMFCQI